ncbi:ankyrin repeat-containing protein [Acanthamoeba castellanii str. Neff]|uniref:Ankyrin repeat-containing protein n=1 Tax=Acanthamoeba castellanii (strain ATCC 30010 / Neff) TaxID=1257118 RepID=L8GNQ4_ACACF|nr:ankyrin repeat-containing protein [Acanthamoeba castellanii str. Neff]ELR14499.1 ankyrin repeat-containing protein [Acanthamoeba castellanii str. Neff]
MHAWVSDPIKSAISSGNLAIVQLLQRHGATLQGRHMVTALSRAERPSMEMLQHLAPALGPGVWRECLTSPALQRGDVAVCRFLVDHGVDINFAFGSGCDLGLCTALHHAVLYNYEEMARCLLECGARADVKTKGMRMTALSLARQYANKASRVVTTHRPGKRKRKSTSEADKKKNENDNENENEDKEDKEKKNEDDDDEKNDDHDAKTKPAKKKQKQKEASAEKREEKELEAEVRRLAKLKDDAKLDVFTLRQMLRRRGVLAGDVPKRKLPLLQLTVDWLSAGN